MTEQNYQTALRYWTIGLQYISLVKIVAEQIASEGNKWVVTSDREITPEQYEQETKWSDHQIVIPVLFNFYHGIELILKGFLIAAHVAPGKNHNLGKLLLGFEEKFPSHPIGAFAKKYIAQENLPPILASFYNTSHITTSDFYQALKYPEKGDVLYDHAPLKYKDKEGIPFFEDLVNDINTTTPRIVDLGRSLDAKGDYHK